jgi:hypothetical protein
MQAKAAIERIITRTAESLSYPRPRHLCATCGRYLRSFCPVGMEITHGDYYHEVLSDCVSREWGSNEVIPGISISITTCIRYRKERR